MNKDSMSKMDIDGDESNSSTIMTIMKYLKQCSFHSVVFWVVGLVLVVIVSLSGSESINTVGQTTLEDPVIMPYPKDIDGSKLKGGNGDEEMRESFEKSNSSNSNQNEENNIIKFNRIVPEVIKAGNISYASTSHLSNVSDPTAILLIKIPKVGGTTLSVTLERYCHVKGMKIARPGTFSLRTCRQQFRANIVWDQMMEHNRNGIDAWLSHSCFQPFMLARREPKYWRKPERQLAVSMLREPWSRTISSYRYGEYRCKERPDLITDQSKCGRSFRTYLNQECASVGKCSLQFEYLSGRPASHEISEERAAYVVNRYDLVFLTERFNEGLIVLHLKFGFPWMVLPYILANHNVVAPYPTFSEKLKSEYLRGNLQPDAIIHQYAWKRMDEHILSIGNDTFYSTLELLNETNKLVKVKCNDKKDPKDCLETDKYIMHGASCYHKCIEEVAQEVIKSKRSSLGSNGNSNR